MGITRQQVQVWLREWHAGAIPFDAPLGADSYLARVSAEGVDLQPQLIAAFELRETGEIDADTYQIIRAELEAEYNVKPALGPGNVAATFTPWAPGVQTARPVPAGWSLDEGGRLVCIDPKRSTMTGRVKAAETVKATTGNESAPDPVRSKGGRFLPNVAEVWYYDPSDGIIRRQVFAQGEKPISRAWRRAREVAENWKALGIKDACVWLKCRAGGMKGNRWIFMADSNGILATPQDIVRLHAQALAAEIKAPVGEKHGQTLIKHVKLMLEQNKLFASHSVDMRNVDVPCVEPPDKNEIVYSVLFQSGAKRAITIVPLPDEKDPEDKGKIMLSGHRKRAFRLLLETPSGRVDQPKTVKYVTHDDAGKPSIHVIGRDEALKWAEAQEDEAEDEVLVELHQQFLDGEIDDAEYVTARGRRLEELDPAEPKRRGPVMHRPATRVEYVKGRHYWGKAHQDDTPGSRWVGQRTAGLTGGSNWYASVENL